MQNKTPPTREILSGLWRENEARRSPAARELHCAAMPDWILAARALASPLSLTQTSVLQLSPLAIGLMSIRGDVTPARRPLAVGGTAQLFWWSHFSVWQCSDFSGNFSLFLSCSSLYTFFLVSSVPAAYLPSHLLFSFPAHSSSSTSSPTRACRAIFTISVWFFVYLFWVCLGFFWGGGLIQLFPFRVFIFPRRSCPEQGGQGRLAGHGPRHEMELFMFFLQPPSLLKSWIKASCVSVKHKIEEGTNIYFK